MEWYWWILTFVIAFAGFFVGILLVNIYGVKPPADE